MSAHSQKVLIIQDASSEISSVSIREALRCLSPKPGAVVKLLVIIPAFTTSSRFFPLYCGFGKKTKLHSSWTINKKKADIKEEVKQKLDEYSNCAQIARIRKLAETKMFEFDIGVEAGLLKEVAVQYAKNFGATHVILPSDVEKNKKYFMDNLSCGIYRMKLDSSIEILRGAKDTEVTLTSSRRGQERQEICLQREETFENSVCSVCMNRRPGIRVQTRVFTYTELDSATNGFSQENLLSARGKKIFRGQLNDLQQIMIREHPLRNIKEKDFKAEVQILGKVRHENVATLLGSFSKGNHKLVIYEFVCNQSLRKHLSEKSGGLTWERRIKIAHGAAKGLEYLHGEQIYGSVRPSNILITHDYQPMLSYFGLARNQYEDFDQSSDTQMLKTFDYLPPEYDGTVSDKSKADVFSFGVVLLELITGPKTAEETSGERFLRWARPSLSTKKYMELIDPLVKDVDVYQLFWMVRVVDKCLSYDPESRPSINKVTPPFLLMCLSGDTSNKMILSSLGTTLIIGGTCKLVKDLECIINHCGAEDFSPTESELVAAMVTSRG